jgi:hypothetical protein
MREFTVQILGGAVFGFSMLLAVLVGLLGVAWMIAEAILFLFPGIRRLVMKRLGWTEYSPGRRQVHAFHHASHVVQAESTPAATVRPVRDRAFIALRKDATCRGCGKTRKVFHVNSRLCTRCHNTQEPVTA